MILFVLSIGLADSINPVTIAVALYLASTPRPVWRLANFVSSGTRAIVPSSFMFALYTVGGLVLLFGPASLLRLATHGVDPPSGGSSPSSPGHSRSCSQSWSGSAGPSSCRPACPTGHCARGRPSCWAPP